VGRLVTILNAEFSPPSWSDDRVENAKKRLLNWVQRLMRQNGLDAADQAVFARVARQQVRMQLAEERTEWDRRMRRDVISNCRGRELAVVSV
jgi:hypothetical protein